MNYNAILLGIFDGVKTGAASGLLPPQVAAITLGAITLYTKLRDALGGPPDMLTNAQLASELKTRGIALRVTNDHFLAEHGFASNPPEARK